MSRRKHKRNESHGQILDAALRAKQRLVNLECFSDHLDSMWDFNAWKPKGRDIGFSDIDGVSERYGRFLLIECKHPKLEVMRQSKAAQIMRDSFVNLGVFTYVVIVGDAVTNEIAYVDVYTKHNKKYSITPTLDGIKALVGDWHTWSYQNRRDLSLVYTPCDTIVVYPEGKEE